MGHDSVYNSGLKTSPYIKTRSQKINKTKLDFKKNPQVQHKSTINKNTPTTGTLIEKLKKFKRNSTSKIKINKKLI